MHSNFTGRIYGTLKNIHIKELLQSVSGLALRGFKLQTVKELQSLSAYGVKELVVCFDLLPNEKKSRWSELLLF